MFKLLESIVKFLVGLVTDLVNIVTSISEYIRYAVELMDYFIPIEVAFLIAALFAAIITYKIIGREG